MLIRSRVARLTAVKHMEVAVEEVPEPSPEEMLVKVEAAGVCGSDLHYFRHGGLGSFKQLLPMNMGHEPAGIVADNNGHPGFSVGDRVAIEPGRPCLTSRWSLKGRHNLCRQGSFMGSLGHPGCFADFVCVTPFQCCKLPPTISFETAALLEPISVALHAISLSEAAFSDVVAIYGAGTIGLCIFLMLRRAGVEHIFMVDRLSYRCTFAEQLGVTAALHFEAGTAKRLRELTPQSQGCSLVVDTAGDDESMEACLQIASLGARIALLAIPEQDHLKYNPHLARTKEIKIVNCCRSPLLLPEAVELFSDKDAASQLERLVTHRMALDSVQEAFEMASNYNPGVVKIMLCPSKGQTWPVIRRIAILGAGPYSSSACLDVLITACQVEIAYIAHLHGDEADDVAHLEGQSSARRLLFQGSVDLQMPADVEKLSAITCDLILVGNNCRLPMDEAVLKSLATHGAVQAHLGLQPCSDGPDPIAQAILESKPQGAIIFVQRTVPVTSCVACAPSVAVVDAFSLEVPPRTLAAVARNLLFAEVACRLPGWLLALQGVGTFDMSGFRRARESVQCCGGTNSFSASLQLPPVNWRRAALVSQCLVSWNWRCAFLERFSDALGGVSTKVMQRNSSHAPGAEVAFCVETVACMTLGDLPPVGVVLSATEDEGRFVVRASDGFVTCRTTAPASTPVTGALLGGFTTTEGQSNREQRLWPLQIPHDFPGDAWTWTSEPPPPPAPVAASLLMAPRSSRRPNALLESRATAETNAESKDAGPIHMTMGRSKAVVSADPSSLSLAAPSIGRQSIPIFDLQFEENLVAVFQEHVKDILTSGRPLSENKFCRSFETTFKDMVHAPFAVVTTCGTMALNIALRAIDVRDRFVVTPSNTFFATQVAVENAGGRNVFCECEQEFLQLCPRALWNVLNSLPKGSVAAVVLVHIGGIISPFALEICRLAHEFGARLVEDAAHAHLSHLDGVGWAGSIGDIGAFSFFPTKVMTMGEGGMITTANEDLYQACREIKNFGADLLGGSSRFTCIRADGTNGRVPELSAALGLLECGRVQQRIVCRQELVQEYVRGLAGCAAYRVIQQRGGSCSYYKCIVLLNGIDRDFLHDFSKSRGISFTGEVYHRGVHSMQVFSDAAQNAAAGSQPQKMPDTETACANHACPPLYPELSSQDVQRVCAVMLEAAASFESHGGGTL